VHCFLPVPVDERAASGHDEAFKRYQVQIDSSEVSCRDEIVSVKSKKQGTSASADSADDTVQVDETVRLPQDLINGEEVKGIDFRIQLVIRFMVNHVVKLIYLSQIATYGFSLPITKITPYFI
jgi:hypothetical protein